MNNQREGIRLAGMVVDAVQVIHDAIPRVNENYRHEIKEYLAYDGNAPMPSTEALKALEAAIVASRMMDEI